MFECPFAACLVFICAIWLQFPFILVKYLPLPYLPISSSTIFTGIKYTVLSDHVAIICSILSGFYSQLNILLPCTYPSLSDPDKENV